MAEAAFFSPAWFGAIRQAIEAFRPDVLHVHDIWLGRVAYAARTRERVVMDLHENMPAAVVEYRKGYRGLQSAFRLLFQNHWRIFSYERDLLMRGDLVLTVVEEARQRVLSDHPALKPVNVVNVENLESNRFLGDPDGGVASFGKDSVSVLYIGGFGPHRGIDTLIHAATLLKQAQCNICIQLVGANPSQYLQMLKQLIRELGVDTHVKITGWVATKDVLANIKQADICCVPHHSNPHTDNTIPHKLFQYMIARRPVLVSSSAPLARTVRQANAGLIFAAGDATDCAAKIQELAASPTQRAAFADNGYSYVMTRGHNWEEESAPRLIEAFDHLFPPS